MVKRKRENVKERVNYLISKETLEKEGISFAEYSTKMEINCFGNKYRKIAVVSKLHKDKAIEICKAATPYDCFITESLSYFSIWKATHSNLPTRNDSYSDIWWQSYVSHV